MRRSSPADLGTTQLRPGINAQTKGRFQYWWPLVSLLLALPASRVLVDEGALGVYLPLEAAVVLCAWFGGVGPAMICQLCGAFLAFSFLARASFSAPVTATQLYGLLGFLVIGELSLFLVSYIHRNRDLRRSEHNFRLVATATNDTIWEWDVAADKVSLFGNLNGLFGSSGVALEKSSAWWRERIHPGDADSAAEALEGVLNGSQDVFAGEYRLRQPDDSYILVAIRGTAVRNSAGRTVSITGGLSDVTAMRQAQERLAFDALHDALTGLPNRQYFREQLQRAISTNQVHVWAAAVLFLDLDRFKTVNDSLGHAIGDKLLRAVSKRIELSLQPGELAARFGGDEFTILIDQVARLGDVVGVAQRVQDCLIAPFELEDHSVVVTASIGIALARKGSHPEEVLRHADVAMYRAKAEGRARYEVFESGIDSRRMNLVQLESEIRKGMMDGDFRLYYQPVVDLRKGEISGVEALLRWQHPRRGLLLPGEFLPIAEESGLIIELGNWVMETACQQLNRWRNETDNAQHLYVSVNVANRQFAGPELLGSARSCLKRNKMEGNNLVLELTESIILKSNEDAVNRMQKFQQMGVRFAIDDFGKGYSSLARVHELPVSILKLDGSFVSAIPKGRPVLADAIVALAHQLHLEVTAECVETRAQAEHLWSKNCTAAQGSYFSAPMDSNGILDLIRSQRRWRLNRGAASGY